LSIIAVLPQQHVAGGVLIIAVLPQPHVAGGF